MHPFLAYLHTHEAQRTELLFEVDLCLRPPCPCTVTTCPSIPHTYLLNHLSEIPNSRTHTSPRTSASVRDLDPPTCRGLVATRGPAYPPHLPPSPHKPAYHSLPARILALQHKTEQPPRRGQVTREREREILCGNFRSLFFSFLQNIYRCGRLSFTCLRCSSTSRREPSMASTYPSVLFMCVRLCEQ